MGRPKSFVPGTMRVDRVQRAHNCQHSAKHRLQSGDVRLKVPKGRSFEHYCADCAVRFLEADIDKLQGFLEEIRAKR